MKSGATSQASPVQWRTGADAGYGSDSLAVELLETLAIFNEVESHPSTNGALPHLQQNGT